MQLNDSVPTPLSSFTTLPSSGSEVPKHGKKKSKKKVNKEKNKRKKADVGLSMKCYRKGKEFKTCLGERQLRGRIGKLLYARSLMASCFLKSSKE